MGVLCRVRRLWSRSRARQGYVESAVEAMFAQMFFQNPWPTIPYDSGRLYQATRQRKLRRPSGGMPFLPTVAAPVGSNALCYAIRDGNPVTPLHTLIIPQRHVESFFDLHGGERNALFALLDEMKSAIQQKDDTVEGFNIGINNGEVAGQSVPHVHVHLIPRRRGDVEHPRGGVRGVIPRKASY